MLRDAPLPPRHPRWIAGPLLVALCLGPSRAAAGDDPAPVQVHEVAAAPAGPPPPPPLWVRVAPAPPAADAPPAPPALGLAVPAAAAAPPRLGPPLPAVADPLLVNEVARLAPAVPAPAPAGPSRMPPGPGAGPPPPAQAVAVPPVVVRDEERPPSPPRAARSPPAGGDAAPEVYNAVVLRWGEARVGPAVQALGLLPRVELGTAAGALAVGIYPVWGAVQVVDRPVVDLSLRAAGVWSSPGLVVRGQRLGGALSLRPPGPLELGIAVERGSVAVQGLPADGSPLGRLTVSEGEVSRRISREIERQREGASAALVDPTIDARLAAAATTVQLGLGLHLGPRHQVLLLAEGAPQLAVDGRAALVAVGYARLIDIPGEVSAALPQTASGAAALRQTAAAALAYQWDRDALRVRIGAGVGGLGGYGWLPRAVELSWRPGPPRRGREG
jgi:hypothetical protein